jgi:hypothetical protein
VLDRLRISLLYFWQRLVLLLKSNLTERTRDFTSFEQGSLVFVSLCYDTLGMLTHIKSIRKHLNPLLQLILLF